MINIVKKNMCCGCSACKNICTNKCITMKNDAEGFEYPFIDSEKCSNCGLCEKICPILSMENKKDICLRSYVAYAKEENMRLRSSSGGIFTLLAEEILRKQGVVFGAAFDDKFKYVHHIDIENIRDLEKLRGSKYLQSSIEDTYSKVKQLLKQNRYVLFSGTGCQIAGLNKYLQIDYEKLYTIDILCHGVPSPKVWKSYIKFYENKQNNSISNASFRGKKWGWKNFNMKLVFGNSKIYEEIFRKDYFMNLFLKNICLRPSCHDCKFKDLNRPSDITLGDCWGIENYMPDMDDDKGTSVVLVHSSKGQQLFDKITNRLVFKEAEVDKALPPTADSRKSVKPHPKRELFFKNLEKGCSIDKLAGLVEDGIIKKIITKIKNILKKVLRKIKSFITF